VPDRLGAKVVDRFRTLFRQGVHAILSGPVPHPNVPGSRAFDAPASRSIDPSQQSFVGVPEGVNLRALPLEQQQAGGEAWDQPSAWLSVEIEVTTDESGEVHDARVVSPSGRRAFDRHALSAVREAVARGRVKAALSRWLVEAAYRVSRPDKIAFTFDENALFDRRAPRPSAKYPFKEEVLTRVSLRWVMPNP
jgi:TonB family protein